VASEPEVVRAQLRIDVDSEVQPRREVVLADPPTPDADTRALDAPLRDPVDVLPDELPDLPSEPPVQDEDLLVEPSVIAGRLEAWQAPAREDPGAVLAKYARLVSCASRGAVTSG
jgi:hypothetical protein